MKFAWLVCVISIPALGQIPQIASGGIVNAASFDSLVAPGGIASIFGSNLAASPQAASAPFPLSLGGTSVTMNGLPAPILFVSPGQINVQVPAAVAAGSFSYANASLVIVGVAVVVTTAAGASAPANAGVIAGSPSFFSVDGSGCGQAAALNITPDGVVSANSSTNSAAPGDYVALFGTDFGVASAQPADGNAATGAASLLSQPGLFLNMNDSVTPSYAGLAPSFPGVDQINFQLPAGIRNGCAVPVATSQVLGGPPVTISVQKGRGQCVDPPIQSYGMISFYKSVGEPPAQSSEFFSANFPAGPGLVVPPSGSGVLTAIAILTPVPLNLRSCPVPGYSELSAGAITIQPPSGAPVMVMPQSAGTGGSSYSQALPSGFLGPGTYAISGTAVNQFALDTSIQVGSPITVLTNLSAGTGISASQPLTVQWTGGDSSSIVTVTLSTGQGSFTSPVAASSGSVTFRPPCNAATDVCSFGTAGASVGVTLGVTPATAATAALPGITFPVQLSWEYSYFFGNLTLTN